MGRLAIQAARTARPARSPPQSAGTQMSLTGPDPRQQASRDPVLPGSHTRSGQGTAARAGVAPGVIADHVRCAGGGYPAESHRKFTWCCSIGCRKRRSSPMARQPPRSFRDHQTGFRTQRRCNGHRFSEGRRTDADRLASPGSPEPADQHPMRRWWPGAQHCPYLGTRCPPLLLTQCD